MEDSTEEREVWRVARGVIVPVPELADLIRVEGKESCVSSLGGVVGSSSKISLLYERPRARGLVKCVGAAAEDAAEDEKVCG